MSGKASDSEERLNSHPILKDLFRLLPDIIEYTCGDYDKAGKAELKFIDELRKTGKELMNERASGQENVRSEAMHRSVNTICHGKKTLSAYGIRRNNGFGEGIP